MSKMNRSLFGSFGNDDCGRRSLISNEEDRIGPADRFDHDRCRCFRPVEVVLNAATGGAGPLPIIAVGDLTQTIPVVSVTIDADCVCNPSILLTFTTLINLPVAVAATLSFAVVRTNACCGTTPITIGPGFTYSVTVVALESDSFSFQLFDSDLDCGTYTYTVVLTPNTVTTVAGVTLLNSTLSALAVDDAKL